MEIVPVDECEKFHPQQWVNMYGIVSNRCEYINTCQVYQVETTIASIQRSWFKNIVLEPVDESQQPISVEEAMKTCRYF